MNPAKVGLAVQGGLSIVCATCKHYWQGRERNLPGVRCTSTSKCGSPLVGDDFHDYNGPISDFTQWCFMCGTAASYAVRANKSERLFGVCKEHALYLHEMRPLEMDSTEARTRDEALLVRTLQGVESRPYQLFGLRKKTLREVISETEAEWADAAKARGEADAD